MNFIQNYLFVFSIGASLSAVFLVLAKKISLKYKLYDDPGNDPLKRHKKPISFLGGAAIITSFIICLAIIWIFGKINNFGFTGEKISALFVAGITAWFYGFWDDTYWQKREKIGQSAKILLQIPIVLALAFVLYLSGIKYLILGSALPGIFLAAFLFLFISNATNLQDGIDGLASGIILISLLGFSIVFAFSNHLLLFLVCASVCGALASFLVFNWHPASIFLGNNGSYFLGFLIALMAIMASEPSRFFYSLNPLLIIGFPILNVAYVFTRRILDGKSPFCADRNHAHDHLFVKTNSVVKTVGFIYFFHLVFVTLGVIVLITHL